MRFLDTKTHGYLDYLVGIILMVAPWLLNFDEGGAETWVPVSFGAATILYSLLTDYELGASPRIPMRVHLVLDFLGGVFLALSPWIFGFHKVIFIPHLALGLFAIGASLCTKTHSSTERRSQ